MPYLFSSESVSSGHPDKIADIISDSLLDYFLSFDPDSRVACETLVTTGQVIIAGEVTSSTYLDIQNIVRNTLKEIGYDNDKYKFSGDSCGIISLIHEQSQDIARGITKQKAEDLGAGDQGIMFGYACNETENYIPLSIDLSHEIMKFLEHKRKNDKKYSYLRPDAKAQVTVEYSDDNELIGVKSILISSQHDEFDKINKLNISNFRKNIISLTKEFLNSCNYHNNKLFDKTNIIINPAGKFVIGGPHGDTGLTGRKIIVDTYGGKGSHGGGAFSGKDSTKVDRSAAYMARYLAKNMVSAGVASEIQIQLAYAIGMSQPVSVNVNTFGTSKINFTDTQIGTAILNNFDLSPYNIQKTLKLRKPIFKETASYGHFGRTPITVKKMFNSPYNGNINFNVELFTWEKLDLISKFKNIFNVNE